VAELVEVQKWVWIRVA